MAPVFSTVSTTTVLSSFAFFAVCGIVSTITLVVIVLLCLSFRRRNDVVHTKPVQLTCAVNTRTVVEPRQTAAQFEFIEFQTITDRTTNGNKRNPNTPIIVESSASSSYLEPIHSGSRSNEFPGKIIRPTRDKTMSASAPLLNAPKYVETLAFVETVTSAGSRQFGHGINVSGGADEGVIVDSIDQNGAVAAAANCVAKGDRIKSITVLLDNADVDDVRAILDYAAAYPIRLEVNKDRSKSSQATVNAELADPVIRIAGPSTNFLEPAIDLSVATGLPEVGIDLPDGKNKVVAVTPVSNLSASDPDIKVDYGLKSVDNEIHYVRPAGWQSILPAADAVELSVESTQLESTSADGSFNVEVKEELPLPAGYIRCVKTPTKVDLSAPSFGQEPLDFGGSLKRRQNQNPDVVFAERSGKVRFFDAPTVHLASASNPSYYDADVHTKALQTPTGELANNGDEPSDLDEPRFVSYTPALASSVKLAEIQAKQDVQSPMADIGDFNLSEDVLKSATVNMLVISPVKPSAFSYNSLTKKTLSADGDDGLQSPEIQMKTALVDISSDWTLSNRHVTDEDVDLEIASPEIGGSRAGLSWDDADVIIPDIEATVNEDMPLNFTSEDGAALNASAELDVPSGSVKLDPVEKDISQTSENATLEIDVSPLQPPQPVEVVHVDSLQAGMMELIMGGGGAGKIIEVGGDSSAGAQVHRQPVSVAVKSPKKKSRFLSLFQKKSKKKDPSIGAAADASLDLRAGASPSVELSPASIEVHSPKLLGSIDADLPSANQANFGAKPYIAATGVDSNEALASLDLFESTEPSELHASANMDLNKPEMDLTSTDVNENKMSLDLNDVGFQSGAGLELNDGSLALEPNFSLAESFDQPDLKVNGSVPEFDSELRGDQGFFDELHGLKVQPASLDLEASSDFREPGASVSLEPNVEPQINSPVLAAEESMTPITTSSTSLQFGTDSPKVNLNIDEPNKKVEAGGFIGPAVDINAGVDSSTLEAGGFIEPAVDINAGFDSSTLESPSLSVSNVSTSGESLRPADAALKVNLNDQPKVHGLSASVDPKVEINASVVRPSHPKEEKKSKGFFGGLFKSRSKKDKGKSSVKGPTSPAAIDVGHASVGLAAGQKSPQGQVNVGTLSASETSGEFVGITASRPGASVNVGNVQASALQTDDKNLTGGIELPEAELTGEQIHVETPTLQPMTLDNSSDLKGDDKSLAPATDLPVVPLNADGQLVIEPEVELNRIKDLNLVVDAEEPRVNFNSSGSTEMRAFEAFVSSPSSPTVAISGGSEVHVEQIHPAVAVTAAQPTVHVDVKGHKKESGGFGGNIKNIFKSKAKKHEKQETVKVSVNGSPNIALSSGGAADDVTTTQPTITANHSAIVVAKPEKIDDHLQTSGASFEVDSAAGVGSKLLSVEAQSELDVVGLDSTQSDGATVSLDNGLSAAEQALPTLPQNSPSVPSSTGDVESDLINSAVDAERQEQLQISLSEQSDSRLSADSEEYDINVGEDLDMGLNADDMFETIRFQSLSASPSGKITLETKSDSSSSEVVPVGINGSTAGMFNISSSVGDESRVTHNVDDDRESAPPPLPTAAVPFSVHLANGKASDYDDDDEDDVRRPDDSVENEALSKKREILSLHGLPRSGISVKSDALVDSGDLNNNEQDVMQSSA